MRFILFLLLLVGCSDWKCYEVELATWQEQEGFEVEESQICISKSLEEFYIEAEVKADFEKLVKGKLASPKALEATMELQMCRQVEGAREQGRLTRAELDNVFPERLHDELDSYLGSHEGTFKGHIKMTVNGNNLEGCDPAEYEQKIRDLTMSDILDVG